MSSPRPQVRRSAVSPAPSSRDRDYDQYSDENDLDAREVEAALSMLDDEITNAEDALTEWSRESSSVGLSATSSYTGQYSGGASSVKMM